jgi:uncharacterized membrane protein YccC
VFALAVVAAACGADLDAGEPSPSSSFGVVTPDAARRAVLGLCELGSTTDALTAEATFLDRSHATLHAIAAEAEARDRPSASALLEAKQRVEAALARDGLPPRFQRDVENLIDATRTALDALGIGAPACPS